MKYYDMDSTSIGIQSRLPNNSMQRTTLPPAAYFDANRRTGDHGDRAP